MDQLAGGSPAATVEVVSREAMRDAPVPTHPDPDEVIKKRNQR